MYTICHLSSVHRGLDIRIYRKECVALAQAGFAVHLVIDASAADVAEAAQAGVTVHPLNRPGQATPGRLARVLQQAARCRRMAAALNADLYHFHDPELIPHGLWLRQRGKQVIYDVHEDVRADIASKPWIPAPLRAVVGTTVRGLEQLAARRLSALVVATPHIGALLGPHAAQLAVIHNYPIQNEMNATALSTNHVRDSVCYVGAITATRGIRQVVQALELEPATLLLAGQFDSPALRTELQQHPGWRHVHACGVLNRQGVADVMARSFCGLVTLLPEPNYLNALPIKLFEYMAAGLPVIASDFPLWRSIINDAACGLCVDPQRPAEIAAAIRHLRRHPALARQMGQNGQRAVASHYRWDREAQKLVALYDSLLAGSRVQAR